MQQINSISVIMNIIYTCVNKNMETISQSKAIANVIDDFLTPKDHYLDIDEHEDDFSFSSKRSKHNINYEATNQHSILLQPADQLTSLKNYRGKKISRNELNSQYEDHVSEKDSDHENHTTNSKHDIFEQLKIIKERQNTDMTLVSTKENTERPQHSKNQLILLDAVYSLRIALQTLLVMSNQLPYGDLYQSFVASLDSNDKMKEIHTKIFTILCRICQLQKYDSQIPSNSINDLWEWLDSKQSSLMSVISSELDSLWQKAHFHSQTDLLSKKFKTIQQNISSQITYLLQNKEKMISKTRIFRHDIPVLYLDKSDHCPHIYDDTDFYNLLLKDIINSKTLSDSIDKDDLKKNKEKKRIVASKGRILRYDVHSKLMNFMAPRTTISLYDNECDMWNDDRINSLFNSLPQIN